MGKGLIIMAGHTFLKENQNIGWEHFAKDHLLGFAWKMTMLLAFPANRQIYDSPCTLAIKWEMQKWQQNLLRYFFEWKKKENTLLFDQTIHWRWREESGNMHSVDLDCGIQATCPDWKWGKRWPLEPRRKALRIRDYILLHPRIRIDRSSMK